MRHVNNLKPDFVALHLQEVGGKTYEKSMEYVQQFIQLLCEAEGFEQFDRIRVYLDEDYNSAEHFTVSDNRRIATDLPTTGPKNEWSVEKINKKNKNVIRSVS